MRAGLCTVLMASLIGCGPAVPPGVAAGGEAKAGAFSTVASADGDRIPAGWVVEEMVAREINPKDRPHDAPVTARVLLWRVKEDERPLYVEKAIVWVEVREKGAKPRWLLLHVFRHPREKGQYDNQWRLAQVADSPVTPLKRFDTPPRSADIREFLKASDWTEGMTGFRELGAGVCLKGWKAATGEAAEGL
jgi:hypothetical protein